MSQSTSCRGSFGAIMYRVCHPVGVSCWGVASVQLNTSQGWGWTNSSQPRSANECACAVSRIREAIHEPEHASVAISLTALGNVLSSLGRYAEARQLYERALDISDVVFGQDHPHFAKPQ
jgi:hypothetical protein